ncbi:methyltransferase domain-containing protein [Nocardioides sp. GXQ0305]|uniref:methyltransferase domain-containing protein n=1 Tax=Nocardioides sp. GXQ0305 TaxID=3423912 RepID=UPI003D7C38B9
MAGCCDPRGYDEVFGDGFARHVASRYRRRGLDRTARRLVDFLAEDDLSGASVLEIGGGVGEIGVELLRRGAARATTLELSQAYDDPARRLAEEAGVADRVHRAVVDIATSPDDVEPADLVVLHRVVCCYPDHERLLGAAADHCRRRLAFSHPPRNPVSRGVFAMENALFRLRGREFRAYVHRPQAMAEVVTRRGMRRELAHAGTIWQVQGLTR